MSVDLYVDALAQAVSTISVIDKPESFIFCLAEEISKLELPLGTGSCQISSSSGISGPRYLVFGPISLCNSLNHARAKASANWSGFS